MKRLAWTEEDIIFLKNNYSEKGVTYCIEQLNRSENSILKKASQLKIKVKIRTKRIKIEKNKILIECKVCNNKIETIGEQSFLRLHISKFHNITTKEYYDLYFKKENEGICSNCGKPTRFIAFSQGYSTNCGYICGSNNIKTKNKTKETIINKYGVDSIFKSEEFKINSKKTIMCNYGVENVSQNNEIKKKKVKTNLQNCGAENYTTTDEFKERVKKTCLEKYNVDNPSKCEKFKEKRSQTIFNRYGVYHYSTSREYRLLKEKLNEWIPSDQKTEFELYSREVWNETKKHKKKLFSTWNGKCYYTEIELDKNQNYNNETYPTIDHKICVFYGFNNNINPKEIGNISNLSVCSRWANRAKQIMNEEKFVEYLKENNFFNKK